MEFNIFFKSLFILTFLIFGRTADTITKGVASHVSSIHVLHPRNVWYLY